MDAAGGITYGAKVDEVEIIGEIDGEGVCVMDIPAIRCLECEIKNEVTELIGLNAAFEEFLESQGIQGIVIFTAEMVLEEVLTNVIKYAYRDGNSHTISVRFMRESDALIIEVEDDGVEFDPVQAPAPDVSAPLEERPIGGLGIFLVKKESKEVSYRRHADRNILRVVLAL